MTTTLKLLDAKQEIATFNVKSGETLTLSALDNINYQLIDEQTQLGPQQISAQRVGEDLHIYIDNARKPEIIVQSYYAEGVAGEANLIIGQGADGQIYAYTPTSGTTEGVIGSLSTEQSVTQTLGGQALSSTSWAFNPWWALGLVSVAAAGVALASNGGG
ncbi:hypothetical protein [Volucribacter amazonae]|uniref:Uncharacterized protein n=1 Tax=Volucribacter amazonae TaxID=256731 RepID=A0A9X4PAM9_9PAST|nr:hypothetical protein [Volucribacter amazonae]MDG6894677.1 hypothetical protein [Volucribacter amazonae]